MDMKQYQKEWRLRHPNYHKDRRIRLGWIPKTDFLYTQSICRVCKEPKEFLLKLSKSSGGKQYYSCRDCNNLKCKKYRNTSLGKERHLMAIKKWESNNVDKIKTIRKVISKRYLQSAYINPDKTIHNKYKARWIFGAYRKRHRIVPLPCQICGGLKVDAHHPDYTQPCTIVWLCREHHVGFHQGIVKIPKSLYNKYR